MAQNFDGERLRRARVLNGLSAPQLAEKVGCSTAHIYSLELGRRQPSADMVIRLEHALGIGEDMPDSLAAS